MTTMTLLQKRLLFYAFIYSVIAFIAVGSMAINVKAYSYINKRHDLLIELQTLKDENRDLDYTVSHANTLEKIETIVTTKLNMSAPKKIHFINL
jgi:cell division protein FtsL